MKNTFKVTGTIILLTAMAFLTAACAPEIPVTGITMDKRTANIPVGGKETLKAIITPGDATNQKVTWDSLDNNIATVSSSGIVTGKAVGEVYIIATTDDGGKTDFCIVNVIPGSGGGDNDGFLGAALSISDAQAYTGKWNNETHDYVYTPFNGTVTGLNYVPVWESNDERDYLPLSEVFNGTNRVTLANGKLSIRLGTPKDSMLIKFIDMGIPSSLTISNKDAKLFLFQGITDNDNQSVFNGDIYYMYVDRDVKISGTEQNDDDESDYTSYTVYDWNLKTGWNSLIFTETKSNNGKVTTSTMKTGKPTGNEKWIYNKSEIVVIPGDVDWANAAFTVVIDDYLLDWQGFLFTRLRIGDDYYYPDEEGFTCQWYRNGVAIPDETSSLYSPQSSDAGKALTVRVFGHGRNEISAVPYIVPSGDGRPIPSASDFNISNLYHVYDGTAKRAIIEPKEGKSQGIITIYYNGSTTRPSALGTYSVTFDVGDTIEWKSAYGLSAGQMRIESGGSGGTFTFTGIPSKYNGKYAYFSTNENNQGVALIGLQSVSGPFGSQTITLTPISYQDASFPVWKNISFDDEKVEIERFSGSGTFYNIGVVIFDSQIINQQDDVSPIAVWTSTSSVYFSNGNASMSWSQGEGNDIDSGLSAPTNVTATRTSSTNVSINWNSVSGASYYEIYSSSSTDDYIYYNGSSYSTSFTSTGNRSDAAVYFKVVAVNSAGERSSPSSWASVAPDPYSVDNNGFLGSTLSLSGARVYTGDWYSDIYEYVYYPFNGTVSGLNYVVVRDMTTDESEILPLNEVFSGYNNVTLTNGNLSINLGTPYGYALTRIIDEFGDEEPPPGFTISDSNAKVFMLSSIGVENRNKYIYCNDDVLYIYADRNVRISWTESYYEDWNEEIYVTYVYDWDLKTGWNSIIRTETQSVNSRNATMKTGKFTGIVKWEYNDYSYEESGSEKSKITGGAAARKLFSRTRSFQ